MKNKIKKDAKGKKSEYKNKSKKEKTNISNPVKYEIIKNTENSNEDIDVAEIDAIINQIKNIDLNTTKNQNMENSDSDSSVTEKLPDIKNDFIDNENTKDFLSKNNKKINSNYNEYEGLDGNLNNKKNPFIQANNNAKNLLKENSNVSDDILQKEKTSFSNILN